MMNDSNSRDDNLEKDQEEKDTDFGRLLAEARKTKNYTVDEVSDYLKIPVRTIIALEASDKDNLPASTFTQGYIRAYAKFLETSEEAVLVVYNRAVPHSGSRDLKPRCNLPDEANSQSPLIKAITLLLILAVFAAIGVGGFQYYQEKAGVMGSALDAKQQDFTGNSLNSPASQPLVIKQNARLVDGELVLDSADSPQTALEESVASAALNTDAEDSPAQAAVLSSTENVVVTEEAVEAEPAETSPGASSNDETSPDVNRDNDSIEIIAENGSWVEVRDANKSRLLYNMLPVGGSRVLVGRAPFSVTMGNAETTHVVVNDIAVDVSDYIRSNNIASFKVSTQGQDVIFH